MSRRSTLALGLALAALSACSSEKGITMNAEETRLWMSARQQNGAGALDANQFKIEYGEVGDSHDEEDTIEFAGGRFRSSRSDDQGFGSALYATRPINGGWEFHVTCKNQDGAAIYWEGNVRGDDVEGVFVWTKKDEPTVEHRFHGRNTRPGAVKQD